MLKITMTYIVPSLQCKNVIILRHKIFYSTHKFALSDSYKMYSTKSNLKKPLQRNSQNSKLITNDKRLGEDMVKLDCVTVIVF